MLSFLKMHSKFFVDICVAFAHHLSFMCTISFAYRVFRSNSKRKRNKNINSQRAKSFVSFFYILSPAIPLSRSLSLSHVRTIRLSTCLPWLHALQHILLRFRQFILFNFILFRERVFFLSICFFVSLLLLLQAAAAAAVACLTRENSTDMVFMCLFYTSTLAAALYVAFARMHFVLNVV